MNPSKPILNHLPYFVGIIEYFFHKHSDGPHRWKTVALLSSFSQDGTVESRMEQDWQCRRVLKQLQSCTSQIVGIYILQQNELVHCHDGRINSLYLNLDSGS